MALDQVAVGLIVLAFLLLPMLTVAGLFVLVDRLVDGENFNELRQAHRQQQFMDFPRAGTPRRPDSDRETYSEESLSEQRVNAGYTDPDGVWRSDAAAGVAPCPNCGLRNEVVFRRCWNCQEKL